MKRSEGKKRQPLKKGTLKRLLSYLFHDYKGMLIAVLVCIALSAIAGVVPAIYIKIVTQYIQEGLQVGWNSVRGKLIFSIVVMVGIYLVGLLASITMHQLMAFITQGFLKKMRIRMFNRMQELPIRFFDTTDHGDIMSHYTNDVDAIRQLISQSLPQFCASALTISCLLCVMLYYSISLMLVVIFGVFLMLRVTAHVGGNSARYFVRQQRSIGDMEGFVEEMMNGQKVVKVFCHEQAAKQEFDEKNEALRADAAAANFYGNSLGPIMGNIGNLLYVLAAFTGGVLIALGGKIPNLSLQNLLGGSFLGVLTIPVIVSYLGMTRQFTMNVNQIAQQINAVAMGLAGAERIMELLDQEPEADSGYVTLVNAVERDGVLTECEQRTGLWAWKHPHGNGTLTYTKLEGDVRMEHMDFAYEEGKTVLHDITLYAEPGQKVAFVGATGAGKTTITNLINRFYDIADGKIRYDGININKIRKADLRRSLGIVLQDVNLFTGTVMENIRYGKLDASDEECIRAAKLANAHDFITRLPQGYQTELTNNGANLSQGQRQLLSIARAAVADPPVMILDEATSSIDTRTESLVQAGMDRLMKGRTVFVIAHRLSTVKNSDVIMVLDHGRIIERGTHDDLIAQKGVYYQLYNGVFELE